jgi:hypothetical protein
MTFSITSLSIECHYVECHIYYWYAERHRAEYSQYVSGD